MKSSCIQHPANEPLIIIRKSQVEFCGGNPCAAALMSFFEYWHNIKLDMQPKNRQLNRIAEEHGDEGKHDTSLYQFHTLTELEQGIMGIYGISSIKTARKALVTLGVISEHTNPNKRYAFDKTIYYLFHPETYQKWLQDSSVKNNHSIAKNNQRVDENNQRSVKTGCAITEITSEVTTEILNSPLPPLTVGTPPATCNEVQGASSTASQGKNPETAGSAESPKSHADTEPATHAKAKGRKRSQEPANRFTPPTEAEVLAYCQERQNGIIASVFVDFYEAKGWMIGRNKMVCWKSAVRTWERNRKEQLQAKADPRQQSINTFEQANQSDGWIDLLKQQGDQYADIHF